MSSTLAGNRIDEGSLQRRKEIEKLQKKESNGRTTLLIDPFRFYESRYIKEMPQNAYIGEDAVELDTSTEDSVSFDNLPVLNMSYSDIFNQSNLTSNYFTYLFDLVKNAQGEISNSPSRRIERNPRQRAGDYENPTVFLPNYEAREMHPTPKQVDVKKATETSLLVEWDTPMLYPIEYYLTLERIRNETNGTSLQEEQIKFANVGGLENSHTFTNLEPGNEYSISVKALYGDGLRSDVVNITSSTRMSGIYF